MLKVSQTVVPSAVVYGKPGVPPRSKAGRLNLRAPPGAAMSMRCNRQRERVKPEPPHTISPYDE